MKSFFIKKNKEYRKIEKTGIFILYQKNLIPLGKKQYKEDRVIFITLY